MALLLKEGITTLNFFLHMANARRNANIIGNLTISCIQLEKEEEIKEDIFSYFKATFEDPSLRTNLAGSYSRALTLRIIKGPFSKEELTIAFQNWGGGCLIRR